MKDQILPRDGASRPLSIIDDSGRGGLVEPDHDCDLCPRLVEFRTNWRKREPDWHNGPVPTLGSQDAKLMIVGLAPGLRGANRTGRPFTGDYAGELLYNTLIEFGFAAGSYGARSDDGLRLTGAVLTNAVRCVPPQNKPVAAEIAACRQYLENAFRVYDQVTTILALGRIAHQTILRHFQLRQMAFPFSHGGRHRLNEDLWLFDSYHCSRYNTQTRRLTGEMFRQVFSDISAHLSGHLSD